MLYSFVMQSERERLKPFRQALGKGDQEAIDHLFDRGQNAHQRRSLHGQSLADGNYPAVRLLGTREDN